MPLLTKRRGARPRNTYTKNVASAPAGGRLKKICMPPFLKFAGIKWVNGLKRVVAVTLLLMTVVLVPASVCAVTLWLYNKAVTSEFFVTKHVDVTGNVRLSRDMVLQYCGIKVGDNSLAVSIINAEQNLLRTPWVEEVSVKRLLPDRFVIRLKERLPSFWIYKDDVLYYANEAGEAIAPVESGNFLSLPTLAVETGAEDATPYLTRLIRDMHSGVLPVEFGAIASVTASAGRGIEIYMADRELRLSVAVDDWDSNLTRLGTALGDLAGRHELKDVREVRAANGDVWVILNKPAQG
ncbi:MAG: cell division protein FtsQ [Candidatus Desulfovibrio kirbyi]|uniref:Cell division protein FtsQ n=1 Tax=Candidatus Desulfovibrio kirbyi TaxID=2696086 RepID=A0A6L2R4J6_9BACT|nr:MAG: cell division protein FtsQ [Candidatus Desulfovibrio kirbyi]